MRAPSFLRLLTPVGWSLLAVALVVAIALAGHGLGFRWDPFDLNRRRIVSAETRAAAAEADAAARRLEVEGAAAQARRSDAHHRHVLELERATARAQAGARRAHDAEHPLDPARAGRLAEHDRELCRIAPPICIAAATEPAAGDDRSVPPGPAAGAPDAG